MTTTMVIMTTHVWMIVQSQKNWRPGYTVFHRFYYFSVLISIQHQCNSDLKLGICLSNLQNGLQTIHLFEFTCTFLYLVADRTKRENNMSCLPTPCFEEVFAKTVWKFNEALIFKSSNTMDCCIIYYVNRLLATRDIFVKGQSECHYRTWDKFDMHKMLFQYKISPSCFL